jgi:hypothetical protein
LESYINFPFLIAGRVFKFFIFVINDSSRMLEDMDFWLIMMIAYCLIAFFTFVPVIAAMMRKVEKQKKKVNNPFNVTPKKTAEGDGTEYEIGNEMRTKLSDHFNRIAGALIYWKIRAEWNRRFHYYTLCWTLAVSIFIPVMLTFVDIESYAKIFLIIVSLHSALLLAFHRALKIENNYKAFRHGKSEFCDICRRMLDDPKSFGETKEAQLSSYFAEAERIRRFMRSAEIDNFPGLDETQENRASSLERRRIRSNKPEKPES